MSCEMEGQQILTSLIEAHLSEGRLGTSDTLDNVWDWVSHGHP
jgi:hypothetical protein